MGSVVSVLIVFFGGIWLAVRYWLDHRTQRDRRYWFEGLHRRDRQAKEPAEGAGKRYEERRESPARRFWDRHFALILGIFVLAFTVIASSSGSIALLILCALMYLGILIMMLKALLEDAGDRLIRKSVDSASPTREQLEDVARRYGLPADSLKVRDIWRKEEFERRRI